VPPSFRPSLYSSLSPALSLSLSSFAAYPRPPSVAHLRKVRHGAGQLLTASLCRSLRSSLSHSRSFCYLASLPFFPPQLIVHACLRACKRASERAREHASVRPSVPLSVTQAFGNSPGFFFFKSVFF
jgi:hypothetical protein